MKDGAGGESLRPSGQRAALRHRPQLDGTAARRGQRRRRTPERDGRIRAPAHPRAHPLVVAARTAQAAAHHAARGTIVHPRRQSAAMAELVAACRLQSPRGHDAAHRPLPRRRPDTLGGTPDVVRRDDRAVPRLIRRPLPAHRIRHRRMGAGLHDDVAGTGLRLPRRDPLPRRRAAQQQGRAVHHHQRRMHPRRGQRGAVEARRPRRRRRGAPDAPAHRVVSRHRRQLRVPGVLAALPGWQHRMRGPRHRDHGDHADRALDNLIPTARWSTNARMRPSTSTFWWRGWTSTSTAPTTPST